MSEVLGARGGRQGLQPRHAGRGEVLDGASLTLAAGEVVALVAPSGAGKSTLLHIAGLLDVPSGGAVRLLGQATAGLGDRRAHPAPPRRRRLRLPVPPPAAGVLGAGERGAAAARRRRRSRGRGAGGRGRSSTRSASRTGSTTGRPSSRAASSSGSPSRGRSPTRPRLLLADEPTGNLDPRPRLGSSRCCSTWCATPASRR